MTGSRLIGKKAADLSDKMENSHSVMPRFSRAGPASGAKSRKFGGYLLLKTKNIDIKKHIVLIAITIFWFILYSFYFNGFGTNAPVMMEFYRITSAQQGFIFTMHSIGALAMSVYLALQGERYNKINVIATGMIMLGSASAAVGLAPPYTALLMLVLVGGVGCAALEVMLNSMMAELYPEQKNTLITILYGFSGIGAITAPLIITTIVNPDVPISFVRPFVLIGVLGIGLTLIFFIASRRIIPETPYADMAMVKKRVSENPAEIFKIKKTWIFLAASILYFSFHTGVMNWLPTYCREIGMDFGEAGSIMSAFFMGALIMRFSGPLILRIISVQKAYVLFSLLSAAAITTSLFMTSTSAMMALMFIGGFMQGSCVAFLVLMSTEAFPHRVASASSLIFIALNLSGMTAPLWMGALALYTGFRTPLLIICALMVLSVYLVIRATKLEDQA